MAAENGRSHPGPGKTAHTLLRYYANRVRGERAAELKIVAYFHDTVAIEQFLDRLGLSQDEPDPQHIKLRLEAGRFVIELAND